MEQQRQEAIRKIKYSTKECLESTNNAIKKLKEIGAKVPLVMTETKIYHLLILEELKEPRPSIGKMNGYIDSVGEILSNGN